MFEKSADASRIVGLLGVLLLLLFDLRAFEQEL